MVVIDKNSRFLAFSLSGFLAFWLSGFLAFWLLHFLTPSPFSPFTPLPLTLLNALFRRGVPQIFCNAAGTTHKLVWHALIFIFHHCHARPYPASLQANLLAMEMACYFLSFVCFFACCIAPV
ncbi:hypothetical protein [Erwinia sp.]|uniref:hypothetical protein n=1 Tax=Erwinia citreus TaxID=558 RepID=UPI0028A1F377|nr:hypothetical protein [Erwinia sp.]